MSNCQVLITVLWHAEACLRSVDYYNLGKTTKGRGRDVLAAILTNLCKEVVKSSSSHKPRKNALHVSFFATIIQLILTMYDLEKILSIHFDPIRFAHVNRYFGLSIRLDAVLYATTTGSGWDIM